MTQVTSQRRLGDLCTLTVPQLSTEEQFVVGVWRCCDAFAMSPDPPLARIAGHLEARGHRLPEWQ